MAMALVYLPFPKADLSPNARSHWAKSAMAKKAYRQTCGWQAKTDGLGLINADALDVKVTFFPPDKRRRDLDNMLASLKSGLDGVSDVCGIDDSKWTITLCKAAPIAPDGMVKIELEWTEKGAKAA